MPIADARRQGAASSISRSRINKGAGVAASRFAALDSCGGFFRAVIDSCWSGAGAERAILWGLGGHVIKCGLAPVLIDLMQRGYATGFVMNGAAAIHDFEIAIAGQTSEDVEAVLPDGSFGAAEETGREMNEAILRASEGLGLGEALSGVWTHRRPRVCGLSLLHEAYRAGIPITVHVAIGTDTPHTHPAATRAAIGEATHHDFRLLCAMVKELNEGGVYLNVGSAVVLPEVFLKAVSAVRNLGNPLAKFYDRELRFSPALPAHANVVKRPHAQIGRTRLLDYRPS